MSLPTLSDAARRRARAMQDALAGNSGLREGLRDDDAIPFVDWGRAQAEAIAALREMPDEEAADAGMLLADLMTTMTWAVVFRHSKDAAWLTGTLRTLNGLSQDLFGEGAPQLTEETISAWVAGQAGRTDGDLLHDLMAHFALPGSAPATPGPQPAVPPPAASVALSTLAGMTASPVAAAPGSPPVAPVGLSTLAGLTPSPAQPPTVTPAPAPPPAPEPPAQIPHSFLGIRLPGRRRPAPPAETPAPTPGDDHD